MLLGSSWPSLLDPGARRVQIRSGAFGQNKVVFPSEKEKKDLNGIPTFDFKLGHQRRRPFAYCTPGPTSLTNVFCWFV